MRARTTTRSRTRPRARRGAWWVVTLVVVLLVAAVVVSAYALGHVSADAAISPDPGVTTGLATNSAAPSATATSRAPTAVPSAATATATATVTASAQPTAETPTLAQTGVAIVTAGWRDGAVSVSGYVTVVEDGGTCTLTVTHGDVTVTGSRAATADATTTSCGVVTVRDSRLTPGTWQAVLSYTSAKSNGVSAPTSITIG